MLVGTYFTYIKILSKMYNGSWYLPTRKCFVLGLLLNFKYLQEMSTAGSI